MGKLPSLQARQRIAVGGKSEAGDGQDFFRLAGPQA